MEHKKILTLAGMGPGAQQYLTLGLLQAVEQADAVFAHTLRWEAVLYLQQMLMCGKVTQ